MENLDKKTFAIGVLSVSALVLFVANLIQPARVNAAQVVKDRDYTAVTARVQNGGEALYLTDNRTGTVVVFMYNPAKRQVEAVAKLPIANAFGAGGGAVPPKAGTGRGAKGGAAGAGN